MTVTNEGTIVSVRGSVVDARFDASLPPIYAILRAGEDDNIVLEVLAQMDERQVRAIGLTPTQGLARGMRIRDTGDLLQSSSKMATPGVVGERHYRLAQEIRKTLAQYEELKDIIAMLGLEQLSPEDRNVVARARRLERFLTQPFVVTEQFSGIKGTLVSLKDSLDGCQRILDDEFNDYPESALYMIGKIEEAKRPIKS